MLTSRLRSASLSAGVSNSAKAREIVLTSSISHDCCAHLFCILILKPSNSAEQQVLVFSWSHIRPEQTLQKKDDEN